MRKILVLRGGALGDFIVTLPALALLRQRWPDARIELAGNATAAQLARARGLLDAVHSQHDARWSALFGAAPLPQELADWLGDFDLVVNYWPDPEGELQRRFPLHAGQTYLTTAALPTDAAAPAAAHYCTPLRALGLAPAQLWFPLGPLSAGAPRTETIALHPGSGSPRKNWPQENWLALIARLPAPLSLVLGEAEAENWRPDALAPRPPELQALVAPPLEELVAHFASCRLFLGHDSGISHLAAASGADCVLLFGPTSPAVWAPPAPNVRVLRRGPALSSLSVDAVRQAVAAALADRT